MIAGLLEQGKLNATGCMTLRPNWNEDSRRLRDLPASAAIGLHLVLTDEMPLTGGDAMPSIAQRRRGAVDAEFIAAEVEAQFDAFAQAMGRPPSFVDGHQHAHSLLGIRSIVLAAVRRHAPAAWLRTCQDRAGAILRRPFRGKAIGSAWHSRGMRTDAHALGLATNDGFGGHYDFASDWSTLLPRFLAAPGQTHLVMCHPGADDRPSDTIAAARVAEAAALARIDVGALAADHGLAFQTVAGG